MPQLPFADPLTWFRLWLDEAETSSVPEPTAMSLATVNENGRPTVRIVLLKGHNRKGFVFYTNLESKKGRHLKTNPGAALCFLWKQLGRQIRIDGSVEPVSEAEADAYFATRQRGSQIGAWASKQSAPLEDRGHLLARLDEVRDRFADREVTRPPFWSGFRVIPQRIEFWQLGDDRLHDRWQFDRQGTDWQWERRRLYP